jgi:hypothetical protein
VISTVSGDQRRYCGMVEALHGSISVRTNGGASERVVD